MFSSANAGKRSRRRWVVGGLLALVLVPGLFIFTLSAMPGLYGNLIERQVAKATGMELQLDGFEIALSPLVLSASTMRLGHREQPAAAAVVSADRVRFELELVDWLTSGSAPWSAQLEGSVAGQLPLMADAQGSLSEGVWTLAELQAELGASKLSGHGEIDPAQHVLSLSLNSPLIQLDQWLALQPESAGRSQQPTDFRRPLAGWKLDLAVNAEVLEFRKYRFEQADVSVTAAADQPERLHIAVTSGYPNGPGIPALFSTVETQFTLRQQERGWLFDALRLSLDGLNFNGSLLVNTEATPPRFEAGLQGDTLDINQLRTSARLTESEVSTNDDQPWVLPDQELDWSWLHMANARLALDMQAIHINHTVFRNNRLRANLAQGTLSVTELSAELREGRVSGDGLITPSRAEVGVAMETELLVDRLQPADLGMEDTGLIDGGETNLLVDLSTSGASIRDLAGALAGEFALEVQSATVRNDWLDLVGSDLLTQLVSAFIPGTDNNSHSTLECGAAFFNISDGVLQSADQIILETPVTIVRGTAMVDLVEGSLRADFQPSARTGLGIGLGNLASLVSVAGTITDPQIEVSPGGIVKTGATLGAAFVTGGMSLLAQGLFDRSRNAGGTACGQLLQAEASG